MTTSAPRTFVWYTTESTHSPVEHVWCSNQRTNKVEHVRAPDSAPPSPNPGALRRTPARFGAQIMDSLIAEARQILSYDADAIDVDAPQLVRSRAKRTTRNACGSSMCMQCKWQSHGWRCRSSPHRVAWSCVNCIKKHRKKSCLRAQCIGCDGLTMLYLASRNEQCVSATPRRPILWMKEAHGL